MARLEISCTTNGGGSAYYGMSLVTDNHGEYRVEEGSQVPQAGIVLYDGSGISSKNYDSLGTVSDHSLCAFNDGLTGTLTSVSKTSTQSITTLGWETWFNSASDYGIVFKEGSTEVARFSDYTLYATGEHDIIGLLPFYLSSASSSSSSGSNNTLMPIEERIPGYDIHVAGISMLPFPISATGHWFTQEAGNYAVSLHRVDTGDAVNTVSWEITYASSESGLESSSSSTTSPNIRSANFYHIKARVDGNIVATCQVRLYQTGVVEIGDLYVGMFHGGDEYIALFGSPDYDATDFGSIVFSDLDSDGISKVVGYSGLNITSYPNADSPYTEVAVPYESLGFQLWAMINGTSTDGIAANGEEYVYLWSVKVPSGATLLAPHRAGLTPSAWNNSLFKDAGTYEISAFATDNSAQNGDVRFMQFVNTIKLTILPVINVSWIACSYEG